MASLPLPEITRFLNLNQEELEIEASTRATVTAQLKQSERQFLAQRVDLRAKQTIPPSANDAQITAELDSLADDILKNEEELARNDAIVMLIAKLIPHLVSSLGAQRTQLPVSQEIFLISQ